MQDNNADDNLFNVNDLGSMNSDKIYQGNKKILLNKYLLIGISFIIIFVVIIILIIIFKANKEDDNKNKIGEIKCIFKIDKINTKIKIIGNEFKKESDFDIYIEGNKLIDYSKEIIFNKTGELKINFELYENINMDFMFKNITNLISVEMNSKKNAKIISMISTFESCSFLEKVDINGFDTSQLLSIKKSFYNSAVSDINLNIETYNIEDMSFAFAGTNLNFDNLFKLNINKNNVQNISYIFYKCSSLTQFNFSLINISNVKDMSHMFESCESLKEIDFFDINIINVNYLKIVFL